ncbi:calcium/proton exchanger [Ascobolus immersus RN42]|uniref:Calcium/proton exchanger n=1 Tax=Ascobolus immersus RN42 TaxID=1160509 RepID=A0A3N4IQV8_ASCIM|nr:calcium/proton exchanger [Ascobolus immersus RN42]
MHDSLPTHNESSSLLKSERPVTGSSEGSSSSKTSDPPVASSTFELPVESRRAALARHFRRMTFRGTEEDRMKRQMSHVAKDHSWLDWPTDEATHWYGSGIISKEQVDEILELDQRVSTEADYKKKDRYKDIQKKFTRSFMEMFWYILRSQSINILLPTIPVGIIVGALHLPPAAVFAANCIAIIPLAGVLSFATDELSTSLGEAAGGLANATFGNAVEFIVSIFALLNGEVRIVQASMLGSILSNLLLVLGCCFAWGGRNRKEQKFDATLATTMSSLLAVSSASLLLPAVLYMTLPAGDGKSSAFPMVLDLSRYSSFILVALYGAYLFFSLKTHNGYFERTIKNVVKVPENAGGTYDVEEQVSEESEEDKDEHWEELWVTKDQLDYLTPVLHAEDREKVESKPRSRPASREAVIANYGSNGPSASSSVNGSNGTTRTNTGDSTMPLKTANETTPLKAFEAPKIEALKKSGKFTKVRIPARHLRPIPALVLLFISTVLVSVCADYLVDAIDPFVKSTPWLSKTFIGLIIIPIVGNAAEHFTAVIAAGKDKMNLAVTVAVGSSLQIALGLTPLLVLVGWAMGQPMSLYFQPFETVCLFVSVLIAHYLIADGKSNYLEGIMLIGVYVIIGICFFVIPDDMGGAVVSMFTNMISW